VTEKHCKGFFTFRALSRKDFLACFCRAASAVEIIDEVCASVIAAKVFPMTLFLVPIARSAFTLIGFDFSEVGSFDVSASFIDFLRVLVFVSFRFGSIVFFVWLVLLIPRLTHCTH
jgi:hypothetical protein